MSCDICPLGLTAELCGLAHIRQKSGRGSSFDGCQNKHTLAECSFVIFIQGCTLLNSQSVSDMNLCSWSVNLLNLSVAVLAKPFQLIVEKKIEICCKIDTFSGNTFMKMMW